jgi:hypothetical protein
MADNNEGRNALLGGLTQRVYDVARAQDLNRRDGSAIINVFKEFAALKRGGGE